MHYTESLQPCLSHRVYPWGTSVVMPLHKKATSTIPTTTGQTQKLATWETVCKHSPPETKKFCAETNPDTTNQLGFCKNAQTADHILTLSTCIEKYVKANKGRLLSCFVDNVKAFDSVHQEALLYKLLKLGIKGRFFGFMEFMYTNSKANFVGLYIVQGYPISPELFKCFIHHLSEDLNSMEYVEVPLLKSTRVTHLLWADDLILFAMLS